MIAHNLEDDNVLFQNSAQVIGGNIATADGAWASAYAVTKSRAVTSFLIRLMSYYIHSATGLNKKLQLPGIVY